MLFVVRFGGGGVLVVGCALLSVLCYVLLFVVCGVLSLFVVRCWCLVVVLCVVLLFVVCHSGCWRSCCLSYVVCLCSLFVVGVRGLLMYLLFFACCSLCVSVCGLF